jgi:hypothetical protein
MPLFASLLLACVQDPAADLASIQKQLSEAENAFYSSLDKVPVAEREKAYSAWSKQQDEFYAKAEALAAAHAKDEVACEALVWVVSNLGPSERSTRCFERVLADFPESERLFEIPPAYVYVEQVFVGEWYERLAQEPRPAKVRGTALFASAQHRLRAANSARRLREGGEAAARLRKFADKAWLAKLEALDPEAETQAVDALFARVEKEFGEVDTGRGKLGPRAKAALHELRNLAIGKLAPEIEGQDLEGVPFKLSEYRGKVVLLDFWGHW